MTTVTLSIVLHESAPDIAACLKAVAAQSRAPDEVVIFDNGSFDAGLQVARATMPWIRDIRSERNLGFAAGHNRAIDAAPADVHVVLNPDCQIAPTFLERAEAGLMRMPRAGALSGRLLRFHAGSPDHDQPSAELVDDKLDSTGMIALRNRRVLDRGAGLPARGRFSEAELVFGASGAAGVYRRAMLEDVAVEGQFFDESFHSYREDVDLAWRAQLRGWACVYEPEAWGRHRRRVAPGRRRALPAAINRRSVANRWRMIARNETGEGWRRDIIAITARDVATIGYCLLKEQSSLAAIADVVRDRDRLRRWRRHIQSRRVADAADVAEWFGRREALAFPKGDPAPSAE